MILTTAISCLNNEELFKQFIKEIGDSGASVILIAFRDSSYIIPKSVIDMADTLNIPIFIIPWKRRFSEISDFVIKRMHSKNLEIYMKIQNSLFNSYFESGTLDNAASIISSMLKTPVIITNDKNKIKGLPKNSELEHIPENYEKTEIRINNFLSGYIYIYEPDKCPGIIFDKCLIEKHIILPLSLWFNKESIENMVVNKLRNDFVWNLANKNYESADEMAAQGMKLGFNLNRPYTCIVLKLLNKSISDSVNEYSQEAAAKASEIEITILNEVKNRNLGILLAARSLFFVIYMENTNSRPQISVESFVDSLEKQLAAYFPQFEFYIGISEISLEKPDFNLLYKNASLALQYCINSKEKRYRFTYKDTKVFQIVSVLSGNPAVKEMAEQAVKNLVDSDRCSDMDLMGTLTEFINNNYNTSRTARSLHLHRQSLLYRLDKIESLTGMSLNSHRDLFLLEVFTRIFSDY
ncbi:helix-turn-helix domain-containing protein [Lachnospiraceae bacterium NSJ-143]|nr:helix-turn-helix domain-containing protein [Lachnospiraceae bacterium NSJ-143]